ncbi:hypothetical protein C1H71_20660 (plasmid) [Iodobacter fluviatilis]|uniref:Uncharacterized protein n=2 Tax=Iodobacter fluviatilis TaxID=537 RepID=A0A7G3GFU3_9NEIS|nr:hypothetical protein C1H71_20660 [Iodobacter fluviatilis]
MKKEDRNMWKTEESGVGSDRKKKMEIAKLFPPKPNKMDAYDRLNRVPLVDKKEMVKLRALSVGGKIKMPVGGDLDVLETARSGTYDMVTASSGNRYLLNMELNNSRLEKKVAFTSPTTNLPRTSHASLQGEGVMSADEVIISKGQIKEWNANSGHFPSSGNKEIQKRALLHKYDGFLTEGARIQIGRDSNARRGVSQLVMATGFNMIGANVKEEVERVFEKKGGRVAHASLPPIRSSSAQRQPHQGNKALEERNKKELERLSAKGREKKRIAEIVEKAKGGGGNYQLSVMNDNSPPPLSNINLQQEVPPQFTQPNQNHLRRNWARNRNKK